LDVQPKPEDVSSLIEHLYDCLHAAIISTRQHFVENNHRHDVPGFFAVHIRSTLQDLLEPEMGVIGFSIDTSGGSFLISYKNFIIKFSKAYNGMLRIPSRERKAQVRFLNHNRFILPNSQQLPGFEDIKDVQVGEKIHLVAFYDLTSSYEFAWLKYACPLMYTSSGIHCLWEETFSSSLSKENVQPQKQVSKERPDIVLSLIEDDDIAVEDDDLAEDDDAGLSS
jgi:hypothetical protein